MRDFGEDLYKKFKSIKLQNRTANSKNNCDKISTELFQ